jgi:hypothetical protein
VIINAVLFNDEYELLKFRLSYYKNVFDKIVLLSSDVTFSGSLKPEYDPTHLANNNIIEVVHLNKENFSKKDYSERWPIEYGSRIQLIDYISDKYPESLIVHTDADEFPSTDQINNIIVNRDSEFGNIPLKTLYRTANWRSLGINKTCSAVSYFTAHIWSTEILTSTHGRYVEGVSVGGELGSHFSYLSMGPIEVSSKMSSFSHSEFDLSMNLYKRLVPLADIYAVDHLGRARESTLGLLRIEKEHQLNSVQVAALEFKPDWFKINPPKHNLVDRIVASIVITKALQNQRVEVFPTSIVGKFNLIAAFFWRRLIKKWRNILTERS